MPNKDGADKSAPYTRFKDYNDIKHNKLTTVKKRKLVFKINE